MKNQLTKLNNYKTKTFINNDINFQGEIKFNDTLEVKGKITGNVYSENGTLIVYNTAIIKGKVIVNKLVNYGKIIGYIDSNEYIKNLDMGYIKANIKTRNIEMSLGSIFIGNCESGNELSKYQVNVQ